MPTCSYDIFETRDADFTVETFKDPHADFYVLVETHPAETKTKKHVRIPADDWEKIKKLLKQKDLMK